MYNIDSSDYTLQENITYRLSKSYLSPSTFLPDYSSRYRSFSKTGIILIIYNIALLCL